MAAGNVPTSNINALYSNTTAGTDADPTAIDNAVADIVTTINDNYTKQITDMSAHASSSTLAHPDGSVVEAKLATDSVGTAKIKDGNVTTAKIADGAVTTPKIADSNVTTAKIADANVTIAKIATGAVTSPKIANGAINSQHIDAALLASAASLSVQAEFDKRGVNVEKYSNLVVDGDWTSAIQAAANFAKTSGIGKVYAPSGLYLTSNNIALDGVLLVGDGIGRTNIKSTHIGNMFTVTNGFNVGFSGVTFDGDNKSQNLFFITDSESVVFADCELKNVGSNAISCTRAKRVRVNRCQILNCGLSGVRWNDPGAGINEYLWVSECEITNVNTKRITGNAAVFAAFTSGTNRYLWVENNRFKSNDIGIGMDTIQYAWITGNMLEGMGVSGEGIAFTGKNVTIADNTIFNFGAAGVLLWVMGTDEGNHTVENNSIYDNNNGIELVFAADTCVLKNSRIFFNRCFSTGTGLKNQSIGVLFYRKSGVTGGSWLNINALFNDLRGNATQAYNIPTDARTGISFQYNSISDTDLFEQQYNLGVPKRAITKSGSAGTFTAEIAHQHIVDDESSVNTGTYADYHATFSSLRDRKMGGVRIKKADVFANKVETLLISSSGPNPTDVKEVGGALASGHFGTKSAAWDSPHFQMGNFHLWVDATGKLRIKNGTPTSDLDGTIVGTQT